MAIWYVNTAAAGGNGTSPTAAFRTLAAATAAASSGDTINVAGGLYRETYSPKAGTITRGNPADRFVLSGGEPLPGLAACTSADADVLGPIWTGMFKVTVPQTFFPGGDPNAANLCEDGVQLTLACERADRSDTFFLTKASYFHTAASVELSGAEITGYRLPAVTDLYTKSQLENATIYFVADSNRARTDAITFDVATKTLRMVNGPWLYENNSFKDSFALFNLPAAARPGEWAFTRSGSNVTIYVRPANVGSVATGLIEYAARDIGLHVSNADDVDVSGFIVRQQGCPAKERCPVTVAGSDQVHLHDFAVSDTYSPGSGGYAQIFCRGGDDPHIHDFALTRAQGQYGLFMSGTGAINAEYPWLGIANAANIPASWPRTAIGVSSGASLIVRSYHSTGRLRFLPGDLTGAFTNGENVRIDGVTVGTASLGTSGLTRLADPSLVNYDSGGSVHDFDISYISASPIRVFTWRDLAIYQGTLRECGRQSHANAINFYEQCHNILVWGVNTETADGYATWQESDAIVLAFCAFSASTSDSGGHRAIAQQQGSHSRYPGEVFGHKKSAVLNCRTSPFPGRVASTKYGNGMDITSSAAPLNRWTVYNNVHQGHNGDDFVAIDDWDYNFNTEPGGPGTGAVGPNDVVSSWALNYTDAESGDLSYKSTAPIRTFVGKDWSSLIPGFKTRWPQVPAEIFTRDMTGTPIDWSRPPGGPTVDLDADYRAAPVAGGPTVPPAPPVPQTPVRPAVRSRVLRLSVTATAP